MPERIELRPVRYSSETVKRENVSDSKPGQGLISSMLTCSYADRREIVKFDHHVEGKTSYPVSTEKSLYLVYFPTGHSKPFMHYLSVVDTVLGNSRENGRSPLVFKCLHLFHDRADHLHLDARMPLMGRVRECMND